LITPQVLASGIAMAIKEGCWLGCSIHYSVFFSGSLGDGIEMVQPLDEAHAVDIVLAQHPDTHVKAVPAASIEGMSKHRLLFSWLESL
jgi:hypothetical protein